MQIYPDQSSKSFRSVLGLRSFLNVCGPLYSLIDAQTGKNARKKSSDICTIQATSECFESFRQYVHALVSFPHWVVCYLDYTDYSVTSTPLC